MASELRTLLHLKRLAFSHFTQLVDRWDATVQLHDDEVVGRFHSNTEITLGYDRIDRAALQREGHHRGRRLHRLQPGAAGARAMRSFARARDARRPHFPAAPIPESRHEQRGPGETPSATPSIATRESPSIPMARMAGSGSDGMRAKSASCSAIRPCC